MKEVKKEERPIILIVASDNSQMHVLCDYISKLNTKVQQATSGQEALALISDNEYALIILDSNMPKIDGIGTAKLIRDRELTKRIPIILITPHDQNEIRLREGCQLGYLDYVFEPLIEEMLLTKARVFLRINEIEKLEKKKEHEYAEKYILELQKKNEELRHAQIAALNIMEDANEAKNELQSKAEELERVNKELNQFAYIASHDLQEPLRTVTNYIQVLEEDHYEQLDEEAQEYFKRINKASQRMKSLISAMLDFSRLGRGKVPEIINVNNLLNQVKEDIDRLLSKTDTQLLITNLPELYAYEAELRMVFQNLILNSIKFSKPKEKPMINISYKKIKDYWQFSVSDNGIGIQKKNLDIIFEIFQRLHLRNEYEGDGIGLACCKKIIELHNGKIWAESDVDRGTTIHFTISNLTPNEKE